MPLGVCALALGLALAAPDDAPDQRVAGLYLLKEIQAALRPDDCGAVDKARQLGEGKDADLLKLPDLKALADRIQTRIEDTSRRLDCGGSVRPAKGSAKAKPASTTDPQADAANPQADAAKKQAEAAKKQAKAAAERAKAADSALVSAETFETSLREECGPKGRRSGDSNFCREALVIARREVAQRSLEALLFLSPTTQRWKDIRARIEVWGVEGVDTANLIDSVAERVELGELDAREAEELLGGTVESIRLAKELAQPGNDARFRHFREYLERHYPPQVGRPKDPLDWVAIFAVMRKLSQAELRDVTSRSGAWDPHSSLRRDELAVFILNRKEVLEADQGFVDGMVPWFRRLSPAGIEETRIETANAGPLTELALKQGEALLGTQTHEAVQPSTDRAVQAIQRGLGLLGVSAPLMGVLVVKLEEGAAHATWIARTVGSRTERGSADRQFRAGGDAVTRSEQQAEGDEFAREILITRALFPELAAWLKPPAPPKDSGSRPPEISTATSSSSTPSGLGVSPWTAGLFAGTPFILDPRASKAQVLIPSALEIAGAIAAAVFFGYAIHNRNLYGAGDYNSAQPANQALAWGAGMLGGVLLIRVGSGLYYRSWSKGLAAGSPGAAP